MENGPVSMYATLKLFTSFPKVNKLLEAINIDLEKSKVKLSLKDLNAGNPIQKDDVWG